MVDSAALAPRARGQGVVGAGGSFGEEALVLDATPMPRSFTASARERCQLLLLPSRCFAAADVRHLVRSCGGRLNTLPP